MSAEDDVRGPESGANDEGAPSSAGDGPTSRLPKLTPDQARLVDMGLPMVERCAAEVARAHRDLVTAEDLLACGTLGLYEAAVVYREDQSPSFLYFAKNHVRGRMLNAMQKEHFSLRARVENAMDRAFCRMTGHQTLDVDVFSDEDDKLMESARRGCADALAAAFVAGEMEALDASPEDLVTELEGQVMTRASLEEALATLSPEEQTAIELVYEKGLTLAEVAKEIGKHVNTAKNRHVSALGKLRAILVRRGEGG